MLYFKKKNGLYLFSDYSTLDLIDRMLCKRFNKEYNSKHFLDYWVNAFDFAARSMPQNRDRTLLSYEEISCFCKTSLQREIVKEILSHYDIEYRNLANLYNCSAFVGDCYRDVVNGRIEYLVDAVDEW